MYYIYSRGRVISHTIFNVISKTIPCRENSPTDLTPKLYTPCTIRSATEKNPTLNPTQTLQETLHA